MRTCLGCKRFIFLYQNLVQKNGGENLKFMKRKTTLDEGLRLTEYVLQRDEGPQVKFEKSKKKYSYALAKA